MRELQTEIRNTAVGQLVNADSRRARVFKSYAIDYCCGGNKTLEQACQENEVEITDVLVALNDVDKQATESGIDYCQWKLDFLSDYIINTHHAYVSNALGEIPGDLDKLIEAHGFSHPELLDIKATFDQIAGELTAHMKKEEIILFPHIKRMVNAQDQNLDLDRPPFGTIQNPINAMEAEHIGAGELLVRIRTLSNDYTVPPDGCTTYSLTMESLRHFEDDLHQHIHLENNILFPSAIKLEKELFGR
jgi:regulator of cell morphogenesis and NO signaling